MEKDLPIPEIDQSDIDGQPPPFQQLRLHNHEIDHDSIYFPLDPTREQMHRQRAYYYANMTMIDEKVGRILETLDEQGYLPRTTRAVSGAWTTN
jgi:arylsulfatase A-like enzyme